MEYAIEKPSNKLLAATELDSDTWVGEVKHIRGKKLPLTAAPSALRFLLSAFPISAFPHARPRPRLRPRRRNHKTGAHPQRPRRPSLRPDPPGGDQGAAMRPAARMKNRCWLSHRVELILPHERDRTD